MFGFTEMSLKGEDLEKCWWKAKWLISHAATALPFKQSVVGSTVHHEWESEMNNLKPITTAHVSFWKNMEDTFCNGVLSFCFSFLFLSSKIGGLMDRRGWTLYQPEMSSGIICETFRDSRSCLTQVWERAQNVLPARVLSYCSVAQYMKCIFRRKIW